MDDSALEGALIYASRDKTTQIFLTYNRITSIPRELLDFRAVKTLYLGYNNLVVLPDEIGLLVNLQNLELFSNQLTKLPSSLGKLTDLRFLNVAGCRLESIPTEMGELCKLEDLFLEGNKLAKLPSSMCRLTCLISLYLHDNPLPNEYALNIHNDGDGTKEVVKSVAARYSGGTQRAVFCFIWIWKTQTQHGLYAIPRDVIMMLAKQLWSTRSEIVWNTANEIAWENRTRRRLC